MNRKLTILLSLLTLILLAAVPAAAAPLAATCAAGQGYDPACDADHDGDIDVLDIQLTAGRWGASGTYVDDGWSLTGNAGTVPGTNFLGTTDNQALEIRVNNQPALRIKPTVTTPNIIGGHSDNDVIGGHTGATIGGGGSSGSTCGPNQNASCANRVLFGFGTIGGGYANTTSGYASTVGGGDNNTAGGAHAVVSGGDSNAAGAVGAAVGGGRNNVANGVDATIPGGQDNEANGNYSFAAGRRAKANNAGAFVLADSSDFDFAPGVNNAFTARFTGGARFILGINASGQSTWTCAVYNGGSWGCSSDRNLKENFQPVDGRAILEKLAALPITTWNAIGVDPAVKRMGPMAQDFYAAFGLGDDDRVITTGDLDGVALASIQGLYQIVQEKDAQIASLEARLVALEQVVQQMPAGSSGQ